MPGRLAGVALKQRFCYAHNGLLKLNFVRARFSQRSPAQAAVLVPLVVQWGLFVLLTQRTTHLYPHSDVSIWWEN